MDGLQFFLEQYETVRGIVDGIIYHELSDDQLRYRPREDQNSLVWLLWHAARWEDFTLTVLEPDQPQVLDRDNWWGRINTERRDAGTAMTTDECAAFNSSVNVAQVRAYWNAVGERTRQVLACLQADQLDEPVNPVRLRQVFDDGIFGSEKARWVEQLFTGRNVAWFLSFITWHHAEHLFGEALVVRSLSGIALGH